MQPYLPFIYTAVGSLCVGFLLGLWTNRLTNRRERTARIRSFRSHINLLLCEVSTAQFKASGDPYVIYDWQKNRIPTFLTECAKIREDIPATFKATFEKAMSEFATQGDRNVDPYKHQRYADKENELRAIFDRILSCAQ